MKQLSKAITESIKAKAAGWGDILDRKFVKNLPPWLPVALVGGVIVAATFYGIRKMRKIQEESRVALNKGIGYDPDPCDLEKEIWRPLYRHGIAKLKIHDLRSITGDGKVYLRVVARNETDVERIGSVLVKRFDNQSGQWKETVLHDKAVTLPPKKNTVVVVPMTNMQTKVPYQFAAVLRCDKGSVIGFDCVKA